MNIQNCEIGECEDDPKYTEPYVVPELPKDEEEGGGGGADLSNYYTKAQTDTKIQQAVDGIEVPQLSTFVISGSTFANNSPTSPIRYGTYEGTQRLMWNYQNTSTGKIGGNTWTPANVSPSVAGFMSPADKQKLDALPAITALGDTLSLSETGELNIVINLEWKPETAYTVGELVTHEGKLYQVNTAFTSGADFDATNLTEIGGGSDVNLLSTYTATVGGEDVYNASYMNGRLDGGSGPHLGLGATTVNSAGSIAIGNSAKSQAAYGLAIGYQAQASKTNSIAIGGSTPKASEGYSIALGGATTVSAQYSIALGYNAICNQERSISLGYQARCTRSNEVSIGASSETTVPATRFLANVTAGELDTDAVNMSQLNAAIARIGALEAEVAALKGETAS